MVDVDAFAASILSANTAKVVPPIKSIVERFDDMIAGKLDDLPPKPPAEVRIFLSSTFADMRAERNWLAREAYPRLKQYCYEELEVDFQVLDMRWGVTDDATNDHVTEELCLREIENCQRLSMGPNFVCILGDRYGFCPMPTSINMDEFKLMRAEANEMSLEHKHLLDDWFILDENAVPPVYVLQPINTRLRHFGDYSNGNEELRKADTATWWDISKHLGEILRATSTSLEKRKMMKKERKHDYHKSVTECETKIGILDAKDVAAHSVCFFRKLDGLDDSAMQDDQAFRHTDSSWDNGKYKRNKEVAELRKTLHEVEVPRKLSKSLIFSAAPKWKPGGINPDLHPYHKKYLETFSSRFQDTLIKLIKQAKCAQDNQIPISEYYSDFDEVWHHLNFCNKKCATFKGQGQILKQIKTLLLDSKYRKPIFVYAESGVGKTSVISMVMKKVPIWFKKPTARVIKFLGTSADSTNIYDVLLNVAGQIADNYDQIMEPIGYKSMTSLMKYFPRFLRNVSRATKDDIFIFLDSLDQLSPKDGAYALKWLPLELPANVHIVVSTLPHTGGILGNARKLLGSSSKESFLELNELPEKTGKEIVDAYFTQHNRTIQPEQHKIILSSFEMVPSPLFLKLVLDLAQTWKSYTPLDSITIGKSVPEAIVHLFTTMEHKFGLTLTSRALGYLTVGLNGLSGMELEDVLSCDDVVLNEVYQYHNPPVDGIVRVPPLLWARIKNDISEYVVERQSQGKSTMFWYHRQFIEAAEARYAQPGQAKILHKTLASMFLAEDGVKRDVDLNKRKMMIKDADRQVTKQPLTAKNKRKLACLPYHLKGCGNINNLKKYSLCNLKFIMTKIQGFGLAALIQDYVSCTEGGSSVGNWGDKLEDSELDMLKACLEKLKSSTLKPQHLPIELLARLHDDKSRLPHVSSLLEACRTHLRSSDSSTLIPLYPYIGPTSSRENHTVLLSHHTDSKSICFCKSNILCTGNSTGKLKIWNMHDMSLIKEIVLQDNVSCDEMILANDGRFLYVWDHDRRCILTVDVSRMETIDTGIPGSILSMTPMNDRDTNLLLVVGNSRKQSVIIWNPTEKKQVDEVDIKPPFDYKKINIKLSQSGKYLLFAVECNEHELTIIYKEGQKNGMQRHGIGDKDDKYKFYALALQSPSRELIQSFRELSKIPALGCSWETCGENSIMIARARVTITFNPELKVTNQQLVKGTKIPQYYRPEYIDNYVMSDDSRPICSTISAHSAGGVMATGSRDGWMVAFSSITGEGLVEDLGSKSNHNGASVDMVRVSPDGKWICSASAKSMIKVWAVPEGVEEVFSMKTNGPVKQIQFSGDSSQLFLLASQEDSDHTRIFVFSLLTSKMQVPPASKKKLPALASNKPVIRTKSRPAVARPTKKITQPINTKMTIK